MGLWIMRECLISSQDSLRMPITDTCLKVTPLFLNLTPLFHFKFLSLDLSLSLSLSLSLNTFSPQMPSRVRSPISSVTLTNLQHSQFTPPLLPPPPPLSRLSSASRSICTYSESELVWHSSRESTARCCWTCGAGFWRRKRRW